MKKSLPAHSRDKSIPKHSMNFNEDGFFPYGFCEWKMNGIIQFVFNERTFVKWPFVFESSEKIFNKHIVNSLLFYTYVFQLE